MNKISSIYLVCLCLIQESFASASFVIDTTDSYTTIQRGSSFRLLDPENIIREGSSKRSRENSASISPSDRHRPSQKRDCSIPRPAGTRFEFSDAHKNTFRQKGISDLQITRIELLQTALFRSPHGDRFDPRSYLSQDELDTIYAKLDSEELRSLIFTLKSLYDKKIPLSGMSPNTIYTPAARLSSPTLPGKKEKKSLQN